MKNPFTLLVGSKALTRQDATRDVVQKFRDGVAI